MTVPRRLPGGGGGGHLFSSSSGLAGTPTALLFLSAFLLMTIGTTVDAHGYLMSPRSRNFLAHSSQDGVGWGGTAADPKVDYEPQSLNRGGLCGARSDVQYTFPENAVGGPMPLNIQATYEQGQEVVLEAILTAHHWGHIEVKACPIAQHGDAPTQECFDQFPLLFVEDLIYPGSPNDPDYPGRAYIPAPDAPGTTTAGTPTGKLFRQKFKLPSNLNGHIVLLQWYYRTGNSCSSPGYDKYSGVWGSPPTNLPSCPNPLDSCGEGAPEQFWNCAEITITNGPGESPTPTPPAGPAALPCSGETGPSGPMNPPGPSPTTAPPPPPPPPPGPVDVPFRCGTSWMDAHTKCGVTCATGNSTLCPSGEYCYADLGGEACTTPAPPSSTPVPPTPIPPTPVPPTMQPPSATPPPPPPPPPGPISLEDSENRMIAYLGNWQTCPTANQIAEYTHIVIAFAVTYTWNPTKNQCRQDCSIGAPVPICENANRQDLVDQWRAMGKKVILSFGGAGMGGSWAGDNNDCWEYCYGKQQYVVDQLNTIVRAQNFDGVDIDYEYFYNTQAAQDFLRDVTVGLKTTLPADQNIVTHAPMEPDCESGTAYYNVLKNNAAYLDFLMPQYYNGFTRPALDGLSNTSGGSRPNALPHYNTLVNDMFGGDATKVIFGFCISDCSGTGSNASGQQAASVMTQLHSTYSCNGGAFFWVVNHDTNGAWSNEVNGAISSASGCGAGPPTPTIAPPPSPTNPPPTNAPPSSAPPPPPPPPPTSDVELIASGGARCGTSELDAREMCGNSCTHAGQCPGTACYATHPNYCGDPNFTPFQWVNPIASTSWARCGKSEVDARSFCKPVCNSDADCPVSDERCYGVHQNYCGSQVAGGSRMLRGN